MIRILVFLVFISGCSYDFQGIKGACEENIYPLVGDVAGYNYTGIFIGVKCFN